MAMWSGGQYQLGFRVQESGFRLIKAFPALNLQSKQRSEFKSGFSPVADQPLRFEPNRGQTDPEVKAYCRTQNYTAFFTGQEIVFGFPRSLPLPAQTSFPQKQPPTPCQQASIPEGSPLTIAFSGASPASRLNFEQPLPGYSHFLVGAEKNKWVRDIPGSARIRYENLYPGIDLVGYGSEGLLEYDFVVSPQADPARIVLELAGASRVELDPVGNLHIETPHGTLIQHRPTLYQCVSDRRQEISGRYRVRALTASDTFRVTFDLDSYDTRLPLVIDPVVKYATFLGGDGDNAARAVAIDSDGNCYVAGTTSALLFPGVTSPGPNQGGFDLFVSKLNPTGSSAVFTTFLGGGFDDEAESIAVDTTGAVVVVGTTRSPDFPLEKPIQSKFGGFPDTVSSDAFLTRLSPAGNALEMSTFLGGSAQDAGYGVAIDRQRQVYIAGVTQSADFPVVHAVQPAFSNLTDAFVAKINAAGTQLVYATYLGGVDFDAGYAIAADAVGNAYLTGSTASNAQTFPAVPAFTIPFGGVTDAFVAKINPTGSKLEFCRYFGGSEFDSGEGIAVDPAGNVYVAGETRSPRLPVVNPVQDTLLGATDGFVVKFDPTGLKTNFLTYLGGRNTDQVQALAIDPSGTVYVAGKTQSGDFPLVEPTQVSPDDLNFNGFVTRIDPIQGRLLFSTFIGGTASDEVTALAVDAKANIVLAGNTVSVNFPTVDPLQPEFCGDTSAFIARIDAVLAPPEAPAGLTALGISATEIDLEWTDQSTTETGFVIERQFEDQPQFVELTTLSASQTRFRDNRLQPATAYRYRVKAVNAGGSSGYTNEAQAKTLPVDDQEPPMVWVLSPNGGEQFARQEPITLSWATADNRTVVEQTVDLSTDGGQTFELVVAAGLAGEITEFLFLPPADLSTTTCRIRVTALDGAGNQGEDVSDADFTINPADETPPQVQIVFPNGGEVFKGGQIVTFRWLSSDNRQVTRQDVRLSTDGGATFSVEIGSGLSGDVQSFDFEIPRRTLKTKRARLQVLVRDEAGNQATDVSDADFKVKK